MPAKPPTQVKPPLVLFLDFDGVLNGDGFLRRQRNHPPSGPHRIFDPLNLAALDQLCVRLAVAAIVVTSTWRIGRPLALLQSMLADEGFEHSDLVVDATRDFGAGLRSRAAEIRAWIAEFTPERGPLRALILDDCELGLEPHEQVRFFRVDASVGLSASHVEAIVAARSS